MPQPTVSPHFGKLDHASLRIRVFDGAERANEELRFYIYSRDNEFTFRWILGEGQLVVQH